jgi:hypothetical protein
LLRGNISAWMSQREGGIRHTPRQNNRDDFARESEGKTWTQHTHHQEVGTVKLMYRSSCTTLSARWGVSIGRRVL